MSLNDPHWGRDSNESKEDVRGEEKSKDNEQAEDKPTQASKEGSSDRTRQDKQNQAPNNDNSKDELDELWSDFTNMMKKVGFPTKEDTNRSSQANKLRSRDDFSRDDIDDSDRGNEQTRPQKTSANSAKTDEEKAKEIVDNLTKMIFGEKDKKTQSSGNKGSFKMPPKPPKKGLFGLGVLPVIAVAAWAVTGFYIVPEGQTGVVTTFGRYAESTMPGFHWHLPMPIQDVQLVDVSSVRTAEIGSRNSPNRLHEALMLTDDENIVDVQFTVQYRIKPEIGAKDFLFNTRAPDTSVVQAAESAMREVVGRRTMDSILFESKAEIAEFVKVAMQNMLDRYGTGIEVMSVAIQNAQPPQQVQAAFNDAVKAGQDRERAINLGEAYMNAVIPKAQGTASRMKEEAEGYKARVIETARGDADRFKSIYEEYKKAPQVTRDRLYIDATRDVLSNVSKVYVDTKSGNNLLYLPLDKIISQTKSEAAAGVASDSQLSQPPASIQSDKPGEYTSNIKGARYQTETDFRDIRSRIRQ